MTITIHTIYACDRCPRQHGEMGAPPLGYPLPDGWTRASGGKILCPDCSRRTTLNLHALRRARGIHPGPNRRRRPEGHIAPPGRDVLNYLKLIDGTGDPSEQTIDDVRRLVHRHIQGRPVHDGRIRSFDYLRGWPDTWPTDRELDDLARQIGWHRGNSWGHFDKALAIVALEHEHDRAPVPAWTHPLCACRARCGDVDEAADHPLATCKGLPRPPKSPPVQLVTIYRA